MTQLIVGLILFFGIHSISIFAESWRDGMVKKLGEMPWKGIYSVVSIVGFYLMLVGYGEVRAQGELWYQPPASLRHVAMLLLIPVFPLLLAVYLPGRIKALVKHPMLLATILWSVAHLMANGGAGDVLLFGGFGVWALADLLSMRKRTQRALVTLPVLAVNDIVAVVVGLGIYAGFVFKFHQWVAGVPLV